MATSLRTIAALATLCTVAAWPLVGQASHGDRNGAQVVTYQCALCHGTGVGGAPRIGDRQAWEARVRYGVEALVQSAAKGKGAMPPRGGVGDLSDAELRQAIEYMLDGAAQKR